MREKTAADCGLRTADRIPRAATIHCLFRVRSPQSAVRSLALLFLAACETNPGYSFLTLGVSQPVGPTRKFVSDVSWRNAAVDARVPFRGNFTSNVYVGWTLLHSETSNPVSFPQGAVSGLQFRDVHSLPMLFGAQYYPFRLRTDSVNSVRPYVGLLAGGYLIEQRTDLGLFTLVDDNWHAGFVPQFGLLATFKGVRMLLDARYNYAFPAGGGSYASSAYSYFGLNVGVAVGVY
jgi:hypothetical protein